MVNDSFSQPKFDAGQHLVRAVAGDHLDENASTIATQVLAIELDERVFTGRQIRRAAHGDRTYLPLCHLRAYFV